MPPLNQTLLGRDVLRAAVSSYMYLKVPIKAGGLLTLYYYYQSFWYFHKGAISRNWLKIL